MVAEYEMLTFSYSTPSVWIPSGKSTEEGMNNDTYEAMEIALYYTLGQLPERETTHRFLMANAYGVILNTTPQPPAHSRFTVPPKLAVP